MIISSIVFLLVIAPGKTVMIMMDASRSSIDMCIEFLGIYAVWLGILQILDDTRLSHNLSNLLTKPINKIFGETSAEVRKNICLNVSSNILGLGSAATPFGLKAMQGLDDKTGIATKTMIMLVVVNSTGLQLLPTTVIGLRALAGSSAPSVILWPTLVSTFVPTVLGIVLVKVLYNKKRLEKKQKLQMQKSEQKLKAKTEKDKLKLKAKMQKIELKKNKSQKKLAVGAKNG